MAKWQPGDRKVVLTAFVSFFWNVLMFCMSIPVLESAVQVEGFPENAELAVMDTSGVLSRESHDYLNQASLKLKQTNGAELFVAVVPAISGYEKSAVTRLFNGLELGRRDRDNGALLLFTTDNGHVRLRLGSALESCIDNSDVREIMARYAWPNIRERRWNTAARNTWNAVAREIYRCQGGRPPGEVMNKGPFAENPVKTYDHPRMIKVSTDFSSEEAIIVSFAALGFGTVIMLALYLSLLSGEGGGQGWSGGSVKAPRSRGGGLFS